MTAPVLQLICLVGQTKKHCKTRKSSLFGSVTAYFRFSAITFSHISIKTMFICNNNEKCNIHQSSLRSSGLWRRACLVMYLLVAKRLTLVKWFLSVQRFCSPDTTGIEQITGELIKRRKSMPRETTLCSEKVWTT